MAELLVEGQKNSAQKTDWFTVVPAQLQAVATVESGQFDNPYGTGMMLTVVVANEAGTCSFTPVLKSLDAFGTVVTLWSATSAIAANGTYQYLFYVVDVINTAFAQCVTLPLPRSWYLELTYAGTPASDKMDVKASACYI
jgi:hypothetical protein